MSGLDSSQSISENASEHAEELHLHSRPHPDVSGQVPDGIEHREPGETGPDGAVAAAGDEAGPTDEAQN